MLSAPFLVFCASFFMKSLKLKIDPMKLFTLNVSTTKVFTSLIVALFLSFTVVHAQEAEGEKKITATSVYNEALALLKAKDFEAGLPLMKQAIELATTEENEKVLKLAKKNASKASYSLGKAKYKAKAYDEAMALYKEGLGYDSLNVSNIAGMGAVLKKQGKALEATDYLVQSAMMYKEKGKTQRVDNTMKSLNSMTGKAYTTDKFDEAIMIGEKALAVGEHASISYYLSRCYLEKGDKEKALELASKAVEIGTKEEKIEDKYYIAQAKAYAALGKKAEAIAAYEKVTGEKYLEQAQYQIGQLKG